MSAVRPSFRALCVRLRVRTRACSRDAPLLPPLQKQHQHFNKLLNELKIKNADLQIDYEHLHLIDNFFEPDRGRDKIRVTRDEKTGDVRACMRKVRLGDLNIYSPKRLVDWRVSVNMEIPGTSTLLLVPPACIWHSRPFRPREHSTANTPPSANPRRPQYRGCETVPLGEWWRRWCWVRRSYTSSFPSFSRILFHRSTNEIADMRPVASCPLITVPPPLGSPTHTRRKDRLSYSHQEFAIDLTQVTATAGPNSKVRPSPSPALSCACVRTADGNSPSSALLD